MVNFNRLVFLAVLVMAVAVCRVQAQGLHFVIPNLEGTAFLDSKEGLIFGQTSKFMMYDDLEFRIGSAGGSGILGISYNLRNLEKIGLRVKYLWKESDMIIGINLGYNFETTKVNPSLSLILLQIGLD